uniref:Protein kinase domain-containing protein n=1 Tax=Kalanchoe fedtschenkoi TaxID=63787 RepID=A0A7N0U823_KALFE
MAPEYVMQGKLSTKADVFSFGVLVLELISGKKNSSFNVSHDSQNLIEWAWHLFKNKKSLDIMDPLIASSANMEQVAICIHIGLLCVQGDPQRRPSMSRVMLMLLKKPGSLEEPERPGYSKTRRTRTPQTGASSSTAKTSGGEYSSQSFGSTSNTASRTTSSRTSPRHDHGRTANTATHSQSSSSHTAPRPPDRHGKRPIQG